MQRVLTVFQLDKVPEGHEHWLQESINKVISVEQAVHRADKHQLMSDLAKKAGCISWRLDAWRLAAPFIGKRRTVN